jgi:hypothetical protein
MPMNFRFFPKLVEISPGTTEIVRLNKLLKLLYQTIINLKGLSIEYVNKANKKYSKYRVIVDLVSEFRTILKIKDIIKVNK